MIDAIEEACRLEPALIGRLCLQYGHSRPSTLPIQQFNFLANTDFEALLNSAELVITHAGVGSVMSALRASCEVIGCPRYAELGEHVDNHQVEWCNEIERLGWILTYRLGDELSGVLKRAAGFRSGYTPDGRLQRYLSDRFVL